ncbi:MAG: methyltransferase domain-containing protein, partial [Actinomycetota bacterium]|nr:methyltransferase domain-containing protein [Actinomycetota bacterium]
MGSAQEHWADQLAAWAIDPEILAAAPESPYGFPPGLFGSQSGAASTHRVITEALPQGGSILDIGCGGGAASIPVAAAAGALLAVDSSERMLAEYVANAGATGVPVTTWFGVWSEVAGDVPVTDVVVAANVVYNVPDIGDFLQTMTDHARHRVVIELTDSHPWTAMAALWRRFHGQERPAGPTTADFLDVTAELGYDAQIEAFHRVAIIANATPDVVLSFNRRRLCLPVEREPEVAAAMRELPPAGPATA